jgi:hypothetical protein
MSPSSKIKKYYIGFAVLLLLTIVLVFYTLAQGSKSKSDAEANKKLEEISTKMDSYALKNNRVAVSLSDAGIDDSVSAISYTKQSNTSYKLCVTYQNASNGYGADWTSILGPLFGSGYSADSSSDSLSSSSGHSYLDTYTLKYHHKKGENCQTVHPYISSSYYDGSSSNPGASITYPDGSTYNDGSSSNKCSPNYGNTYDLKVDATVTKVDTLVKTISFDTKGQVITKTNGQSASAISPIASKNYDFLTAFCDGSNNETSVDSVKAGQKITFYLILSTDNYLGKVITTKVIQEVV